jgi:general stress protein 26
MAGRGRPTVRPVTFFLVGRRIYFCTWPGEAKTKQIKKNPRVEICLPVNKGKKQGYYRIAGVAEVVTDKRSVRRVFKQVPYSTDKYWDGPDDPRLTVILIKPEDSRYMVPGTDPELDVKL